MNEKRNAKLRDTLLKAVAIAAFTAVPATAFAPIAQARVLLDDVNDGNCDLGQYDTGDGSADYPFRISTVEDLAEISDCDYVGTYYYELTNDIDVTPDDNFNNDGDDWNTWSSGWQPIGDYHNNNFEGNFDGNGHTISGVQVWQNDDYLGLFSETYYSNISNLNLEISIDAQDDGNDDVGGLVGYDYGSTFSNINVDANISWADDYVGGLVGDADGTHMSHITTSGYVTGIAGESDNIGGIAGQTGWGDSQARLTNSSSSVVVNDADAGGYFEEVGGLIGQADDTVINHVEFSGSVFGNDYVGGIAGSHDQGLINDAVVTEDAIVAADGSRGAYYIGGVAGWINDLTVSNATFNGTVDAYQESFEDDAEYVGGIVGYVDTANVVNSTVSSTAELLVRGNGDSSYDIGGIAGYGYNAYISGAVNNTDLAVIDADYVGGILGYSSESTVSNSVNRGDVTATLDDSSFNDEGYVGGVVGYLDWNSEVSSSTNKGAVVLDGSSDAYGVGGIAGGSEEALVIDNYNTGKVTGVYNVAGIIGYLTDTDARVARNFSLGKLTAYDSDADGIATTNDDDYFSDSSNVVLLSDSADNALEATELTAAQLKDSSVLAGLGWSIDADGSTWATSADFNSGYPYLAWETVSEEISGEVGLVDAAFLPVQFNGKKRFILTLTERNYLNGVATAINASPYASVDIDVYYGNKVKLAGKRAKAVKRYLVKRVVGAPISVHIMHADGDHAVGSVHITALAN